MVESTATGPSSQPSVPFFDPVRIHSGIEEDLLDAFRRVLRDGRYIMGPDVAALEAEFATWCGAAHGIGVSSGTDALLVALMALGVGPGDEVLVPTLTFFATAGAVSRLGATPVFVDVDPDTLLMDVDQALARRTERTRAVIPVHLFGQVVPMGALLDASATDGSSRSRLTIIEDAAQAHGATDGAGRRVGDLAHVACFSMFPTKPLGGLGDAGMVTTSDDALADRIRLLRTHGAEPKFHHLEVGGNFRLDALQAALLRAKLPLVDSWADRRRTLAARYRAELASVSGVRCLAEAPGTHVYHQFVVRAERRDALRAHLDAAGIGSAIYYPEPLHVQPCFADLPGTGPGALPHAEAACAEVLALPCFPGLEDAEADRVCAAIAAFYS